MAQGNTWKDDRTTTLSNGTVISSTGVAVSYGPRDLSSADAGEVDTRGRVRQLMIELTGGIAGYPGQGATDMKNSAIPAGATILDCTLSNGAVELTDTGTIGLKQLDGTEIDYDGLCTDVLLAATNANASGEGDGALIGTQLSVAGYISTSGITAGTATVMVRYMV